MTSPHRDTREHFRNIKAIFEGFNPPTSPPTTRPGSPLRSRSATPLRSTSYTNQKSPAVLLDFVARDPEDVPSGVEAILQPDPKQPAVQPTSVSASKHSEVGKGKSLRPTLATPKPSWIGPQPVSRPATPSIMAQKITVNFSSPGLQPPVYITTSLSEPQWEILEMGVSQDAAGEFEFTKVFIAQPGEYQYKFRLGPGDWWVCDEGKEVVDDGLGNRNNCILVEELSLSRSAPRQQSPTSKPASPPHLSDDRLQDSRPHQDAEPADVEKTRAPLLPHEVSFGHVQLQLPQEDVPVQPSKPRQDTIALPDNGDPEDDYDPSNYPASPLFRHETGYNVTAEMYDHTPGVDEDEDHTDEVQSFPSLVPSRPEQAHISRHETRNAARNGSRTSRSTSSDRPVVPEEADPHHQSLEQFIPTSHREIVGQIRRMSSRLPEDVTTDDSLASPASSLPLLRTTSQSPSLPNVLEDDGEESTKAHQATSSTPAAPITPPKTPDHEKAPSKQYGSGHHHPMIAELDMQEEAKHPVHLTHLTPPQQDHAGDAPTDGEQPTNEPASDPVATQNDAPATESKVPTGSSWDSTFGLALLVVIGLFASWLAMKVHGFGFTAKDGGATIVD